MANSIKNRSFYGRHAGNDKDQPYSYSAVTPRWPPLPPCKRPQIRNVCLIRQLRLIYHVRPIRKLFVTGKVSREFSPILIHVGPYLVLGLWLRFNDHWVSTHSSSSGQQGVVLLEAVVSSAGFRTQLLHRKKECVLHEFWPIVHRSVTVPTPIP